MPCHKCGENKPLDEFAKSANRRGGRTTQCKVCLNERRNEIRNEARREHGRSSYDKCVQRGRKRVKTPQQQRQYRYGLSSDAYASLFAAQSARCAICERPEPLCVDHDHRTGAVRGLLCRSCNVGIGHLGDDPATVRRAASYLSTV